MALQARRFHGKPLLQPQYSLRDVPWASRDLSGSTVSIVTERDHLVDSIAEITLLCNEATRRKKPDASSSSVPSTKKTTKPLSIEYIFDRIDTDDPIWGLMVRTDTPMSFKGRASNMKSSPNWKRGMLQGFITMTTFTNWQSSFRFDSLHEMAFGQDDDELEDQMKDGLRKYDEDGTLAEELEALVRGGDPHVEGIVYPRIAEVSLFGGLGCGKQLLKLLVEHLESMKATARQNYDYIVLQATENSIPFYEAMDFTRVGCVQGKAPSPKGYHSNPAHEYYTKKHGETPTTIAKEFGVDPWDIVFINKPLWGELVQKSWLKKGTKIFVPKLQTVSKAGVATSNVATAKSGTPIVPKWYIAQENETPRGIAKKFELNYNEFLQANKRRYPDLVGQSKLMEGTRIQISRFDIDEGDTVAYSHWTFPEAADQDSDTSYMMALKLNRKKGSEAKAKPVASSLAAELKPYDPKACGVKDLLIQPKVPQACAPLAPIFQKKPALKEPKKPKRPMTSYGYFSADVRSNMAELQGMTMMDVNKVLSEKWKALSDDDKMQYQERYEESKAGYIQAMKKYEAEMEQFKREGPQDTSNLLGEVDTSLLEKVVKLKSTDGIAGASKFEYYYVLTFIPDLQWVHLIPMRKVGVFGPEHPDGVGRPIWMIVGEDEGKEIDTTASMCLPVTALTMKNSADADDEQWNIYDNGEIPPAPRPAPAYNPRVAAMNLPDAPIRPKKPATSFALFCGDAKYFMKDELGNKPISDRTKLIAERWKVTTDEEKKKYKDQHASAREKYTKALKQYKEEVVIFQRKHPGVDMSSSSKTPKSTKKSSSAKSSKTPKSAMKLKSPPESSIPATNKAGTSQKKKRGQPPKSPADTAGNGRSQPKKRPSAGTDETPTPKRKRGRPRKSPLPEDIDISKTKAVLHNVKNNDPVVLEQLLGKLKGDNSSQPTESNATAAPDESKPGKNDIILSLMDECYRKEMWRQFNILGKERDTERENEVCDDVFELFKQELGRGGGKFFKGSHGDVFEVDDATARGKIIADMRRRLPTFKTWSNGREEMENTPKKKKEKIRSPPPKRKAPPAVKPPPPPPEPTMTKSVEAGENDVVLSLLNEKYKNIMWSHYKKLGRTQQGGCGEKNVGEKIFRTLKKGLGKGRGRFFKKAVHGYDVFEVDDAESLQKIIRDLKRRMESSDKWLVEDNDDTSSSLADEMPSLSPSPKARRSRLSQTSSAVAAPKFTPSRYPRRGQQAEIYPPEVVDKAQKPKKSIPSPIKNHCGEEHTHIPSSPAEGLPPGWVTRRISRKDPSDSRVDKRFYSPELNLMFRSIHDAKLFAQKVEALGKGEAVAMQQRTPSPAKSAATKPQHRPLAPIFMKGYGKKKKQPVSADQRSSPADDEEPTEAFSKTSRYPGRKRIIDDSNFVSDDAADTSIDEPRKKRAKR